MIAANDAQAMDYLVQLTAESNSPAEKEQMAALASQLLSEAKLTMNKVEREVEEYNVKAQLGDLAEVINLSYIARAYFHKSKHWLYQRINGYTVNGQKSTFSDEERMKFNNALNDIKYKIGTFTTN